MVKLNHDNVKEHPKQLKRADGLEKAPLEHDDSPVLFNKVIEDVSARMLRAMDLTEQMSLMAKIIAPDLGPVDSCQAAERVTRSYCLAAAALWNDWIEHHGGQAIPELDILLERHGVKW